MFAMMNNEDLLFELETLSPEAIDLELHHIDRALDVSRKALDPSQQWQTYLHGLALFGTQQWLEEREPELHFDLEECSLFKPELASPIDAVCNVRVGDFKLCILTVGSLLEDEIFVPRAAIDLPEFAAHFYVLVEVCEELEQANVRGFLRYDRLIQNRQTLNISPQEDWTYAIPLTWFESEPDRLLLYLRCLDADAIALPVAATDSDFDWAKMCEELAPRLSEWQSVRRPWWQVLTWEQGAAILTHPQLLDCASQLQSGQMTVAAISDRLVTLGQCALQPILNTAAWLRDEFDRWIQDTTWVLLPSPAFRGGMMSSRSALEELELATQELEWIFQQLQNKGTIVPDRTYSAYRDFQLGSVPLRLYATIWELPSTDSEPEWTLLLVLSGRLDNPMPAETALQVSDESGLCVRRQLPSGSKDTQLYIPVIGGWDETFLAQVSLPTGETQVFPPFGFQPH